MNLLQSTNTGVYSKRLTKRVNKINKRRKNRTIRRLLLLLTVVVVCAGGIWYGVSEKDSSLEREYQEYVSSFDPAKMNDILAGYKNVYELFEEHSLGNTSNQSQLGGYYYSRNGIDIVPSPSTNSSVLTLSGKSYKLSDTIVDNINVVDMYVFYRNPEGRNIWEYSIRTGEKRKLGIDNVRQFVFCDGDYYYTDISSGSLHKRTPEGEDTILLNEDIISFCLEGQAVLCLTRNHDLLELSNEGVQTTIANNVARFLFNGDLWLQDGNTIQRKKLAGQDIEVVASEFECTRLLSVYNSFLFFETPNGIVSLDLTTKKTDLLASDILVGASNDFSQALVYDLDRQNYHVIRTVNNSDGSNINSYFEPSVIVVTTDDTDDHDEAQSNRPRASNIEAPALTNTNGSYGFWGELVLYNSQFTTETICEVGDEISVGDLVFTVDDCLLSEREGDFADSNNGATPGNVYLVCHCDVTNTSEQEKIELAGQYSFVLIADNTYCFSDTSSQEPEYFVSHKTVIPNETLTGLTLSFFGSRSLFTESEDLVLRLLSDKECIGAWKIAPFLPE